MTHQKMMNLLQIAGLKVARGETSFAEIKRSMRLAPRDFTPPPREEAETKIPITLPFSINDT